MIRVHKILNNLHFAATGLLILGLVPALKMAGLPLQFDWPHFFKTFWLGLTIQSAFFATLLFVAGFSYRETILPVWIRYRQQKVRLIILALLWAQLYYLFGIVGLTFLSLVSIAILELAERARDEPGGFLRAVSSIAVPGAYWFVSLVLVFSMNQAVIAMKPHAANDAVLHRIDSWMLFGSTVPEVAHRAYRLFPIQVLSFLDLLYFAMFAQLGAAMILLALKIGRGKAFQLVATVATAGYLSLFIYFIWPSLSPFYSCPDHFEVMPKTLHSHPIQQQLLAYVSLLRDHRPIGEIGAGYFIAFPCMHIASPLIAIWYLRHWKRLVFILLGLDALLCAAIVLLEYHYVADLVGGFVVASLAILINAASPSGPGSIRQSDSSGHSPKT